MAGFRKNPGRLDMALVEADELCPAAATFTQNVFCAAPVTVSKEHLGGQNYGLAKAVIVNSGCANAATGSVGIADAERTCPDRCPMWLAAAPMKCSLLQPA